MMIIIIIVAHDVVVQFRETNESLSDRKTECKFTPKQIIRVDTKWPARDATRILHEIRGFRYVTRLAIKGTRWLVGLNKEKKPSPNARRVLGVDMRYNCIARSDVSPRGDKLSFIQFRVNRNGKSYIQVMRSEVKLFQLPSTCHQPCFLFVYLISIVKLKRWTSSLWRP